MRHTYPELNLVNFDGRISIHASAAPADKADVLTAAGSSANPGQST
jgi:hypothetical protein